MKDDVLRSNMEELDAAHSDESSIINGHDEKAPSIDSATALANPTLILIITNVPDEIFVNEIFKAEFEALFRHYDEGAVFYYLKSFRRSRIVFQSVNAAVRAHANLNRHVFNGQEIKCYYAQSPIETRDPNNKYLEPPEPEKQFLISPPASPPVGWEVMTEREPFVNFDLINAIAQMGPGDAYELHTGSEDQPSIVVHICEDPIGYANRPSKIEQTKCPERKAE